MTAWMIISYIVLAPLAISVSLRNHTDSDETTNFVDLENRSICHESIAKYWSYDFHDCFLERKYSDGGRDLNNIVDRILEHARICIQNSTKPCRPDYDGFTIIMSKVISQMQDYCGLYLEDIKYGRDKIKDLECVDESLSIETYKKCFKSAIKEESNSTEEFQRKVEKAITCTNKYNNLCSNVAKSSLNKMVRILLGVTQPKKESFEEVNASTKPIERPDPPKRWYDYIAQPFIKMWKAIKSFFGY